MAMTAGGTQQAALQEERSWDGWRPWADRLDGRVQVQEFPSDCPDVLSRASWEPTLGRSASGEASYQSAPFSLPLAAVGLPTNREPSFFFLHFVPAMPSTGQKPPAAMKSALTDLGDEGLGFGGVFLEAPSGTALRFRVFAGDRVSNTMEGRWTGRRRKLGAALFSDREDLMENLVAIFAPGKENRGGGRRGRSVAQVSPVLFGVEVVDELGFVEQQEGDVEQQQAIIDDDGPESLVEASDSFPRPAACARAVWKVPRIGWKSRWYARGEGIVSPSFLLAGLGPFRLHLLPTGDRKKGSAGQAAIHVEAPLRTCLQASLEVGPVTSNGSPGVPPSPQRFSPSGRRTSSGSLVVPLDHRFEKSRRIGVPVQDLLSRAFPHDAVEVAVEIAPGERFRVVGSVRAHPCTRPANTFDGTETPEFLRLGIRRVSWCIEDAADLVAQALPGESVHSPEFEVDCPDQGGPPLKFRLRFFPNSTLGCERVSGLDLGQAPIWGTRVAGHGVGKLGSVYLQAVDTYGSVPGGVQCRWFVGRAGRERMLQHDPYDSLSTVMRRQASTAYGVHEVFDSAEEVERDGSLSLGLYMHYHCTPLRTPGRSS